MVCLKLVKTKSLLGHLRYKSFFYYVNQLETDNSGRPMPINLVDVQPNDHDSPFHSELSFEDFGL